MIFTPNLPPQPLTLSTGSVWNTLCTLFKGSTVWAFGLCMLLHSLARSLLCANPVGWCFVLFVCCAEEQKTHNRGENENNESGGV